MARDRTIHLLPGGAGDRVHWRWDGMQQGDCKNETESGNVVIVPGSGGDMGQQVASCTWSDGRGATGTAILYCCGDICMC